MRDPIKRDEGFRLFLQAYQERLYWLVRRMVIEHEDANDVVQDILIKVYRNIERYEGRSGLYTWVYRIATNETISFLRKRNKGRKVDISDETLNLSDRLEADPYFDGPASERILHEAIEKLPPKQRMVFHLRYFEEMSYKEISAALKTSEGALKASFHHASRKIETYVLKTTSI